MKNRSRVMVPLLAAMLCCGCARSPQLSVSLSAHRKSPRTTEVAVTVTNQENRPTVPIVLNVSIQTPAPATTVIHPAAFVLNRLEKHVVTGDVPTDASTLTATLLVKEGETGKVLITQTTQVRVEQPQPRLTSPLSVPSNGAPAIPPPPGK